MKFIKLDFLFYLLKKNNNNRISRINCDQRDQWILEKQFHIHLSHFAEMIDSEEVRKQMCDFRSVRCVSLSAIRHRICVCFYARSQFTYLTSKTSHLYSRVKKFNESRKSRDKKKTVRNEIFFQFLEREKWSRLLVTQCLFRYYIVRRFYDREPKIVRVVVPNTFSRGRGSSA